MIEPITYPPIELTHEVSLYILLPTGTTCAELVPLFEHWEEEFNCKFEKITTRIDGVETGCVILSLETRKQFSLVPAILRKCERVGYKVGVKSREWRKKLHTGGLCKNASCEDTDYYGVAGIDHIDFWKVLALGQMWYEK